VTPSQETHLASLIVAMRTPLARVELAATQLARSTMTPAAQSLATGISEAVSHLDERIADALRALAAPAGGGEAADCRGVLETLRKRMEPVLRARSVTWTDDPVSSEQPLLGDRTSCANDALTLLVAGMDFAGPGGRISLAIERGADGGCGVSLRATRAGETDAVDGDPTDEIVTRVRNLTSPTGGTLECNEAEEGLCMTLWLRRGSSIPCDA